MEKYTYSAIVTDVYDGDSITVDISLGFGIWTKGMKIRLSGIDTPEIRGEEREAGLVSRDVLREIILNKEVIIKTEKDKTGKYGRYLGTVFVSPTYLNESDNNEELVNVNEWLVTNNYAERY